MKKLFAAVLAVALILSLCASALAYTGDVTVKDVKAYSDKEGKEYVGTIPAYTTVLVSGTKYGVAQIYVKGKVLYVKASGLLNGRGKAEYGAGLKAGTRVYQRATTSATDFTLDSNTLVYVYTVENGWALVRTTNKGIYGFVPTSKLIGVSKLK